MSLSREADTLQPLADQTAALLPTRYYSDGYEAYRTLLYRQGKHQVAPGKSQTYSVEGDNKGTTRICVITWRGWVAGAGAFPAVWRHWRVR